MSKRSEARRALDEWYERLDRYRDKLPAKGSVAAALVILRRLSETFDLDIANHVSGKGAQITGLSGKAVQNILTEFGETRVLSAIGGRSNRGTRGDMEGLLDTIAPLGLENVSADERRAILRAMQQHVVEHYVPRHFAVERVEAPFDPAEATYGFIGGLLDNARASGKAGPVAEYLVGAKLAFLYPQKNIRNKQFSTSDTAGDHGGDFEIGNTVFHVTVAPMPELYAKLAQNLANGFRVYLLVPGAQVIGARQNADAVGARRVAVESIESFVATNVDEASEFDGERLKGGLRYLLETYNRRVNEVESDKSLLIEIPKNLPGA
jgi:hypothetical protein